jgi:hypothetical protein
VSAGIDEKQKTSESKDETICLGDSTQSWSPKARLKELYSQQKNASTNVIRNYITKPLLKSFSEEASCCVPIRIELIAAFSQTEFNLCPTISSEILVDNSNKVADSEDKFINKNVGRAPVMRTVSASAKWKGGIKHLKSSKTRSGSTELDLLTASALASQQHSVGATGSVSVKGKDLEDRNWKLESDLHSVSLRFSLFFQDINRIPRNHLR